MTITLIAAMSVLFLGGCSNKGGSDLSATDIAGAFQRGMEYYEKKNWIKAEETFTFIIYNDPAGEYSDDAQFYLGESHFKRDEFLLAINEYDRLVNRMPNSELVEEAMWRKTEAYVELSPDYRLERELTDKALKFLYEFIDYYPTSVHTEAAMGHIKDLREKLGHKYYDSGKLYEILGEYESAIVYYESVLTDFADTDYALLAELGRARSKFMLGELDEAALLVSGIEPFRDSFKERDQLRLDDLIKKIEEASQTSEP